ncbi:hypothetical protein INR49_027535 [Caranx melampygus]|nr:hypothetical protein INR49_027535 [Caranx melampygus]
MDLFDDLPEPTHTSGPVSSSLVTAQLQSTKEEEKEEKSVKRKREDAESCPDKREEEEQGKSRKFVKKVFSCSTTMFVCFSSSNYSLREGITTSLPVLKGFVAARRGEREEMQDAHVLLPDMSSCLSAIPGQVSRVSYFAVFDGHGGARASRYAAEHLHHNLAKKFPSGDTENVDKLIRKCLLDTFRQTDEDFLRKASSQ